MDPEYRDAQAKALSEFNKKQRDIKGKKKKKKKQKNRKNRTNTGGSAIDENLNEIEESKFGSNAHKDLLRDAEGSSDKKYEESKNEEMPGGPIHKGFINNDDNEQGPTDQMQFNMPAQPSPPKGRYQAHIRENSFHELPDIENDKDESPSPI